MDDMKGFIKKDLSDVISLKKRKLALENELSGRIAKLHANILENRKRLAVLEGTEPPIEITTIRKKRLELVDETIYGSPTTIPDYFWCIIAMVESVLGKPLSSEYRHNPIIKRGRLLLTYNAYYVKMFCLLGHFDSKKATNPNIDFHMGFHNEFTGIRCSHRISNDYKGLEFIVPEITYLSKFNTMQA